MRGFIFRILNYLLICAGSLMATTSCSSNPAANKPPAQRNGPVSVQSSTPQASPTPQPTERIGYADLTLVRFPDEPMLLTQVEIMKAKGLKNAELMLEAQNVSKKGVKLVAYGMGVSELCPEYMYSSIPTPYIGYGDWSLAGLDIKSSNEPLLKPGEKAIIKVPTERWLSKLLSPGTYRSCPEGYRKPELMLQDVYFDDGTMWRPNQHSDLR